MSPLLKFEVTFDEYSHMYAALHFSAIHLQMADKTDDRVPVLQHLAENLKLQAKPQSGVPA